LIEPLVADRRHAEIWLPRSELWLDPGQRLEQSRLPRAGKADDADLHGLCRAEADAAVPRKSLHVHDPRERQRVLAVLGLEPEALLAARLERPLEGATLARVGLSPEAFAALAGSAFLGAESAILIGLAESEAPNRQGLRQVGRWIAVLEARQASATRDGRTSRIGRTSEGASDAGP